MVGSRFNKQENFLIRLVLGGYKMSKFLHPSPKTFFFFFNKHTISGFSLYTVQMLSTTHCSVKAMSLKIALTLRTVGRRDTSNTEEGVKSF